MGSPTPVQTNNLPAAGRQYPAARFGLESQPYPAQIYTTNLTPDRATGIGTWTEQVFIDTIRNGKKSGNGRPLLPPMPWMMYGQLSDNDLKSIFMYLKSIPAISNKIPTAVIAGQK